MSPAEPLRVGVLSLARPTFDVPYAEQVCADTWNLRRENLQECLQQINSVLRAGKVHLTEVY